jgi:hypothetical protein
VFHNYPKNKAAFQRAVGEVWQSMKDARLVIPLGGQFLPFHGESLALAGLLRRLIGERTWSIRDLRTLNLLLQQTIALARRDAQPKPAAKQEVSLEQVENGESGGV